LTKLRKQLICRVGLESDAGAPCMPKNFADHWSKYNKKPSCR